jgi:hypothetical protein
MSKRQLFQYCHVQKKVVPIEEVRRELRAIDFFIQDEMEPTRNPLNPDEIYTSKSKLRAAYRAAGAIEVGDAFDRGYAPEKNLERSEKALLNKLMDSVRERLNK